MSTGCQKDRQTKTFQLSYQNKSCSECQQDVKKSDSFVTSQMLMLIHRRCLVSFVCMSKLITYRTTSLLKVLFCGPLEYMCDVYWFEFQDPSPSGFLANSRDTKM